MKNSIFEKKSIMIVTALFCCLLWGSAFPALKITYAELNLQNEFQKIFLAGIRFTLSGLGVLIYAKTKLKTKIMPTRKDAPFYLAIALLQTFGLYIFFYIGLSHTTAVKGSILTNLSVFFVAIFSHFMFRNDKLNWKKGIGLLCGFSGVIIINLSLLAKTSFTFSIMGEGFAMIASVLCAISVVLIRRRSLRIDVVKMNGWQLFIGGVLLLVVGYIGYPKIFAFNLVSGVLLVYMSAVAAIAFTLWFILIKHHKASVVEQYRFAVPLSAVTLSALIISEEKIGLAVLAAALLYTIGIIIVNRQERIKIK